MAEKEITEGKAISRQYAAWLVEAYDALYAINDMQGRLTIKSANEKEAELPGGAATVDIVEVARKYAIQRILRISDDAMAEKNRNHLTTEK